MNIQCPQCHQTQNAPAQFCSRCGVQFVVQPIKKRAITTPAAIALLCLGLCGFCALIGKLGDTNVNQTNTRTDLVGNLQANINAAPTSPPTFAELKQKGEQLLKFQRDEYQQSDFQQFDEVMIPLQAISKEDKNYKEAQRLNKKLIDKTAPMMAEMLVLGARPSEIELKLAFNHYLRTRLNDYDSSEYVDYTPAYKVYVKKEPFWVSILSLRAKNAFGGYILKDVKMYIRNKEVVLADGL